jgi:hypothetical protein
MSMMERLRGWARALNSGRKQLAEHWASPEGQRQFELGFLRTSPLVVMLGEIAMRTARADGWALLSTATELIKREAPSELHDLRKRFGLPNLKAVLLATELFDLESAPVPDGGTQHLYRINERYELCIQRGTAAPDALGTNTSSAADNGAASE